MSLIDDIRAARQRTGSICGVASAFQQMPPDRAAEWTEAFTAFRGMKGYGSAMRRLLVAEGYPISKDTMERHLRGDCACR